MLHLQREVDSLPCMSYTSWILKEYCFGKITLNIKLKILTLDDDKIHYSENLILCIKTNICKYMKYNKDVKIDWNYYEYNNTKGSRIIITFSSWEYKHLNKAIFKTTSFWYISNQLWNTASIGIELESESNQGNYRGHENRCHSLVFVGSRIAEVSRADACINSDCVYSNFSLWLNPTCLG